MRARIYTKLVIFIIWGLASAQNTLAAPDRIKVACIGEQTTHSAHRENDPEYPTRLAKLLGDKYEVVNFGLPKGRVLKNGPAPDAEEYATSDVFTKSKAFGADIVVFGPWGRHDTYEGNWPEYRREFLADLQSLATSFVKLPSHPQVLVALPIPFNGDTEHAISGLLAPTAAVAEAMSLQTIDLWGGFLGHPELYKDGTHLTPDGQQRHAEIVAGVILGLAK